MGRGQTLCCGGPDLLLDVESGMLEILRSRLACDLVGLEPTLERGKERSGRRAEGEGADGEGRAEDGSQAGEHDEMMGVAVERTEKARDGERVPGGASLACLTSFDHLAPHSTKVSRTSTLR